MSLSLKSTDLINYPLLLETDNRRLEQNYEHIDELFSEPVGWELISTRLADLLRVALSIKGVLSGIEIDFEFW